MSFEHIKARIDAIIDIERDQPVTFNLDTTSSTLLIDMIIDAFNVESLILTCRHCVSGEDKIVLGGYMDLWALQRTEVEICIHRDPSPFSFAMRITVPAGFSFKDHFPDIALLEDSSEDTDGADSLMDAFRLATSYIYFSTHERLDPDYNLPFVQGLNFDGDVSFGGLLGKLSHIVELPTSFHLSGPVKEYLPIDTEWRFTGLRLKGELTGLSMDLGPLQVLSAQLLIKSAIQPMDNLFHSDVMGNSGYYLLLDMVIGGRNAQIVTAYDPVDTSMLSFRGTFTDFSIANLNTLDNAVGGSGLESSVPAEIGSLSGIMVTEFGFELNMEAKKLTRIYVGIGCANTWELVPEWLSLSNLNLRFGITNPFGSSRGVEVAIGGSLIIGGVGVDARVAYPSLDFTFQKRLNDVLSIGSIISAVTPGIGELPELYVDYARFSGNARKKSLVFSGRVSDLAAIPVGKTSLLLDSAGIYIDYTKGGTQNRGAMQLEASLGKAKATFKATLASQTTISGTFSNLSLHQLFRDITGSTEIPAELPEVAFPEVAVSYNLKTKAFNLQGVAEFAYTGLPFDSAIQARLEFKVARTSQTGPLSITAALSATGPIHICEGFSIDSIALQFAYNTNTGWQLGGTVGATVLDRVMSLAASYATTTTGRAFTLVGSQGSHVTLASIADGMVEVLWSRLELKVNTAVVEGGADKRTWSLRVDGGLDISGMGEYFGAIELFDDGTKKGMRFRITESILRQVNITESIYLEHSPKYLDIARNSSTQALEVAAGCMIRFHGIPGKIGQFLKAELLASLIIGGGKVRIELFNPMQAWSFPLPDADGQPLGKIHLQLRTIGLQIKPSVGISATLAIGFPKELNTYFKTPVFREYEEGNIMTMSLLEVQAGTQGVNLKFLQSPFQSANANKVNGEDWINFDFGDNGEIAMKMPSFRYDFNTSYFEAAGGFKIIRDLSLPLTPLRNFLKDVLPGAESIFPEKLPIKGISLVDDNQNFKTEDLIAMLGDVPSEVKSALRGAGNLLNRFPDTFKSYLRFEIPTELGFKFGFAPSGRVAFQLNAPAEPIRFLYPGMVQGLVPMPGLIGIELHKLTVGTLASGSLFYGEVDAIIDMYDLPALAASLALPRNEGFPLPTSDQLQRRILLRDVFAIVPLSQGAPVPVPVFYDEIGFEYMGLEGIGLGAHIGIPQPDWAKGGTALLQELRTFFKDRSYRLDPNTPPGGQQIQFKFHDEFLQAPEYLGGGYVGTKGSTYTVGTWKYVAAMLNFCKKFALSDFIGSVPLSNRMGNRQMKLACFTIDGQYLLTTPEEFDGGAYANLGLNANQQQDFKDVLPAVQTGAGGAGNGSSGLILFLRGALNIGQVFNMEASLGMAISGPLGFGTGFKLEGRIGSFLETELKGVLLLNAPEVQYGQGEYPAAQPVVPAAPAQNELRRNAGKLLTLGANGCANLPATAEMPQFCVELWMNLTATTSTKVAVLGRADSNYGLWAHKDGSIEVAFATKSGTSSSIRGFNSSFKFGSWQHIAICSDGRWLRLYINGINAAEWLDAGGLKPWAATTTTLGSNPGGQAPNAQGKYAELRIWRRPRLEAEILRDMRVRMAGNEPSLAHLYAFDASTPGRAIDLCGMLDGTLSGTTSFDGLGLSINAPVWFDGVTDRVIIPNYSGLKKGTFTVQVSCWLDPTQNERAFIFGAKNDAFAIYSDLPGLNKGQWIRITVVGNGTSRLTYMDGTLLKTETNTNSTTVEETAISIGEAFSGEAANFKGAVSELIFFSDAKTATWIRNNLNTRYWTTATAIQSVYRLCEARDGFLFNQLPQGGNRALLEITSIDGRVVPAGVTFNANTKFAHVPVRQEFALSAYTVEFWVKPDSKGTSISMIARFTDNNPRISWNAGFIGHRWIDKNGAFHLIDSPAIPLGVWTHIALTHSGTQGRLYVNGNLAGEKASAAPLAGKATELVLGRRDFGTTNEAFPGSIDEFRVWDKALSPVDVKRAMRRKSRPIDPGLVACYTFDPNQGDRLFDAGPKALHGTLYGLSLPQNLQAASPKPGERMAIQAYGHSHLKLGGKEIMVADLAISDDKFWFKGKIDLFPGSSVLKVQGDVEALITGNSFRLEGSSIVQLGKMVLAKSYTLISDKEIKLAGEFLGVQTMLHLSYPGNVPQFKGNLTLNWSGTLELGAIYIKGVRVCDNYNLSISIKALTNLEISESRFWFNASTSLTIAGKSFTILINLSFAPSDIMDFINEVKKEIVDHAASYLAHIFGNAANYVVAVGEDALEFIVDTYETIADGLVHAYNVSAEALCQTWHDLTGEIGTLITTLENQYNLYSGYIGQYMTQAGYLMSDIGNALTQLGRPIGGIVSFLASFTTSEGLVYQTLLDIGHGAEDAIRAMEKAGEDLEELAIYMADQLGNSLEYIADIYHKVLDNSFRELENMMSAAKGAYEHVLGILDKYHDPAVLVEMLHDGWNKTEKELAQAMRNLGYQLSKTFDYLVKAFNNNIYHITEVFQDLGIDSHEMARILDPYPGFDRKKVSEYLKSAGWSSRQVCSAMRNALGMSYFECQTMLGDIGYAWSTIVDALDYVF